MRLSDAGVRRRQTKLIYPNHRSPSWLIEDTTPRSLEPIVRHYRFIQMQQLSPSGQRNIQFPREESYSNTCTRAAPNAEMAFT